MIGCKHGHVGACTACFREEELTALRSRIAQLEAVCAAQAEVIEWGDELHWQAIGTTIAKEYIKSYDAAKAELEKVERDV